MSNTVGAGNAFFGYQAGYNNTTGACNNFSGEYAYSATALATPTPPGENAFSNTIATTTRSPCARLLQHHRQRQHLRFTTNDWRQKSTQRHGSESSTIRIGGNTGDGPQTAAYIAGIYGSSVDGNGIPVYVDNNGQLGTVVSSRRFKEQIADMGDSTSALMKLRPVTFLYKPESPTATARCNTA